ncbi:hypothetical protein SVAN01_10060 [Stagonosporopsis vannaccii]|nr:hypothetical protein SVAN01_10060 [Stagonosporopsis vannaccii]
MQRDLATRCELRFGLYSPSVHDAGFGWERKRRASHYAAELEARAGGEAALSAAGLTLGAPLERRRLGLFCSQPISSRAFHWLLIDYLILAPTHWAPQRAVNVPSQRQRAGAKIWLACKRSSQAFAAANFVQNKVRPWQPHLSSRAPTTRISSAFLARHGRRPGRMHLPSEQKQFKHLAIALIVKRWLVADKRVQPCNKAFPAARSGRLAVVSWCKMGLVLQQTVLSRKKGVNRGTSGLCCWVPTKQTQRRAVDARQHCPAWFAMERPEFSASTAPDALKAANVNATYVSLERGTHTCGQLPTASGDEADGSHDVKPAAPASAQPGRGWFAGGATIAKSAKMNLIGSRDARAFLDRGSRLPDALIFSASRPIKHCTKRCARRSSCSAEGKIQGRCGFVVAQPQASVEFYETLTSAQPNSDGHCVSRLQTSTSSLRPLPSLSDPAGEPDLHQAFRPPWDLTPSCPPSQAPGLPSCVHASPARHSWDHGRCRTSSAAPSWLEDEPLPWIHAAIDPLDGQLRAHHPSETSHKSVTLFCWAVAVCRQDPVLLRHHPGAVSTCSVAIASRLDPNKLQGTLPSNPSVPRLLAAINAGAGRSSSRLLISEYGDAASTSRDMLATAP